MIEIGILFAVTLLLVGVGLILWRFLRGSARGRRGAVCRVAVLSLAMVPLVFVSAWQLSKSRDWQILGRLVTRVETRDRVVALTFDDGPRPGFTEEVLGILRDKGGKATFFVTGQALEENMAQAQLIVEQGHELGNHSYSHQRMIARSYSFVRQEIERTEQLIRAAGYEWPVHFRPPYGKRFIVLPYYLSVTGRTTVFMDVEPESYGEIAASAERIKEHVLDNVRPGSIVLLHVMYESRAESMRALPGIIEGLQGRGYRLVTVSELLACGE